jgi:hypothetical protein
LHHEHSENAAGLVLAVVTFIIISAYASSIQAATPQQAQCQAEQAQLSQQMSQCNNNACRQQVQAAIAAHNARCR